MRFFAIPIPTVLEAAVVSLVVVLPVAAQREAPSCKSPSAAVTCSSSELSDVGLCTGGR